MGNIFRRKGGRLCLKKNVAPVQPEEPAAKKPTEKKETKAVIYLGPAIAGVAVPGTVYNNGLTPQMEKAVKEVPALSRLLAETKDAGRIRNEIKDPHSAAGICYQKALDYAKKRGAKV